VNEYFAPREASRFLTDEMRDPHGVLTLAKMRCHGTGPAFEYFGRFPRYREDWLREYAMSRRSGPQRSTSEPRRRRIRRPQSEAAAAQ
jgi:hypothetical protein